MAFGREGGLAKCPGRLGLALPSCCRSPQASNDFPTHRPSRGGQPARDATLTNDKTLEKHENMNNFGLEKEAKSDTYP